MNSSPAPPQKNGRYFIQPLAAALAFLLFSLLFFSMAMMDLRRLEGLLMDALRKKALYVIDVVESASQEKYSHLMREGEDYASAIIDDQSFSLQEALIRSLIDTARRVDLQEETRPEHITGVILFDEHGGAASPEGLLPTGIVSHMRAFVAGGEEIFVHLFPGAKDKESPGFVGIRRRSGNGAVALVLDRGDLEYWGWKVSIQTALEELQWGAGVAYISVEDREGKTVARFGGSPAEKVEEWLSAARTARDSQGSGGRYVQAGDMKFLEISSPFQWGGETILTVRAGLETQETERLLAENRKHILLWTVFMVLVGFFAMGLLYRTQNRHLARIQAMRERLYEAERLSSLGKLGAGVAHEIRNPLNAISMAAQRLQRDFAPENAANRDAFERISYIIRDEVKRLNGIVEDFLSLSRKTRMDCREQPLTALLERVVFLAREEAGPRGTEIVGTWADPAPVVSMDAGKMEQALLNIVRNAVDSISGEGLVNVAVDGEEKDWVRIRVSDNGSGIPPGEEERIFDPFYTTRENGLGLGLAIAREIVSAHGGQIRVYSKPGKGTVFEILLPRAPHH